MQSLLILGRQPELGLAELESLYGADKITKLGQQAVIVDVDPCLLAYDRLGGSTRFCKILTTLDSNDWETAIQFLIEVSPRQTQSMPEGKMYLGLSSIGFSLSPKAIQASGFKIKKSIIKTGRPVRYVPNKEAMLSTPQVIHNKLLTPNGWELILIKDGNKTVIAQTVKIQDIKSYSDRDYGRPKRDTKVGMLPPKLAQIIINLAAGLLPEEARQSVCEIPPDQIIPIKHLDQTVLDPFCGTGVVLQEALLMGYKVYGTDLDPRMIEYSNYNIHEWLKQKYNGLPNDITIETADATNYQWQQPINFVASELFLGTPFSHLPGNQVLNKAASDCNVIISRFLENLAQQTAPGTRLCLAIPAWQTSPNNFKHLPLIDQINALGYNRVSFEHLDTGKLMYYRPDQIVARQLLVLIRK